MGSVFYNKMTLWTRRALLSIVVVIIVSGLTITLLQRPEEHLKRTIQKSLMEITNNCTFILDTKHVRNCITGDVIGTIPTDVNFEPYQRTLQPSDIQDKVEESFSDIYQRRVWGGKNSSSSASGGGSNFAWTQEVTGVLHIVINQLKVILRKDRISLLDLPCGDMLWMSRFLKTRNDVDYTGIDVVPELINKHRKDFAGTTWTFMTANVLKVGIQQPYDIIINRMMLQHIYYADVEKLLMMASGSGSLFLLSTTFPRHDTNLELVMNKGRFRRLNLEIPPISLSPPVCIQRDGPPGDALHHYIALWKLPLQRTSQCRKPWAMYLKGFKQLLYSCVQWGHKRP